MSEVISREEPYASELSFLKPEDVLELVKNKDAPEAAKAKRVCTSYKASIFFFPSI